MAFDCTVGAVVCFGECVLCRRIHTVIVMVFVCAKFVVVIILLLLLPSPHGPYAVNALQLFCQAVGFRTTFRSMKMESNSVACVSMGACACARMRSLTDFRFGALFASMFGTKCNNLQRG